MRAENCLAATSRQETRHARSRVLTVDKSRERWALDYATDYDRVPICARKQTVRAQISLHKTCRMVQLRSLDKVDYLFGFWL